MRKLVGARGSMRRACMYGVLVATLIALAVAAAPSSGLFAGASRQTGGPDHTTHEIPGGGQRTPASTTTSTPTTAGDAAGNASGAPRGAADTSGAASTSSLRSSTTPGSPSPASASSPSSTNGTHAPEKLYGRQPASSSGGGSTLSTISSNCQGSTPLGLPGKWNCTFDDEFNGTSLNTGEWVTQDTASSGYVNGATACYVNSPDTVSVSGGYLNLSARQVAPFTCQDGSDTFTTTYEAGMVSTYGLFDQTYGAYEVNAKLPPSVVAGLQETFWLYPQNLIYGAWPASGEIDFAEFYSNFPGLDVPYVHYAQSSTDLNATSYDCLINQSAFNTYGVDWTPTSITILYNGTPCLVDHPTTGSEPFDQPFFIALTQALGTGTDAFTPGVTELPATTQVDWVRAWSSAS